MKRALRIILKILVIAAILIPLALLLKDSSDQLKGGGYDPAAPTATKLGLMQRWLPHDAEVVVIADLHRLTATPGLIAKASSALERAGNLWGIDAQMIKSVFTAPKGIGLVAVALTLGQAGEAPTGVAVVQGGAKEADVVQGVKSELIAQAASLVEEKVGSVTVYSESPSEVNFAFAFPDNTHMIVGPKEALVGLLQSTLTEKSLPEMRETWNAPAGDNPVFGRILFTERLQSLLPPQVAGLKQATFSADGQLNVEVEMPCTSMRQAQDVVLFIEGARAYVLLGGYGDTKIGEIMRELSTAQSQHSVSLRIPLGKLL